MGSTKIQPRKRGASLRNLTDQQKAFVLELLADNEFSPSRAARKAGYKCPHQSANKLLNNPTVQAALGKAQRERSERVGLTGDDVLEYLRNALFINPLHYFKPSGDGKWLIDDPDSLPDWVGRLIDGMEVEVVEKNGTTKSYFKVSLVGKATALSLAMKHVGVEKHEVDLRIQHELEWDKMYSEGPDDLDVIEGEILKAGD